MRRAFFLVPIIPVFAAFPTMAEETGRYIFEKSAAGYVRMDSQTGEISICQVQAGQVACKAAADERTASQDELDHLRSELASLSQRLAALEKNPLLNPRAMLPDNDEFERSLGYMERFFRRFLDVMKDLEKEGDASEKI